MSLIHEQLYATENFTAIDLKPYIEKLFGRLTRSMERENIVIEKHLQSCELGIDQSIPLGLILNELFTNVVKHAFPDGKEGKVTISVVKKREQCEVIVRDDGVGLPDNIDIKESTTLGLKLISILTEQLDGSITFKRGRGTSVRIVFPLTVQQ
jgi:two-component sensor histidine kinase